VKRGELYLVRKTGTRDPRKQRVFIIVSRQTLIDSRFTSVICAPIYSQHNELSTQVRVGPDDGLKKESSIHCDELVSVPKSLLTNYVGSLKRNRLRELDFALGIALGIEDIALIT
jgi:mRNA interferase MazF